MKIVKEGKPSFLYTAHNVLLTPLPLFPSSFSTILSFFLLNVVIPPLHNFIIFLPQCFYSLLHNFIIFPPHSLIPSLSTILIFPHLLLTLFLSSSSTIFIIFPPQCCYSLLHNFIIIINLSPPPPHSFFPSSSTILLFSLLHLHLLVYSIYFSIHKYIDPTSTQHRP